MCRGGSICTSSCSGRYRGETGKETARRVNDKDSETRERLTKRMSEERLAERMSEERLAQKVGDERLLKRMRD